MIAFRFFLQEFNVNFHAYLLLIGEELINFVNQVSSYNLFNNMKIIIKTLQGKQLPVEVEETFTVSHRDILFCAHIFYHDCGVLHPFFSKKKSDARIIHTT